MKRKLISVCVACAIGGIYSPSILAQTATNEDTIALEELIVTARKRQETILEVPLSVSVVDQQLIESASKTGRPSSSAGEAVTV